jgi:hypothetical protein
LICYRTPATIQGPALREPVINCDNKNVPTDGVAVPRIKSNIHDEAPERLSVVLPRHRWALVVFFRPWQVTPGRRDRRDPTSVLGRAAF